MPTCIDSPPTILSAPWREPVEVLAAFADEPWAVALLSDGSGERGRWSYLARRASETLVISANDLRDPFAALAALIGPRRDIHPDGPPFQGGVVGLAAYELGDRVEPLGLGRMPGWPDLATARYDTLLAFDHERREVLAIAPNEAVARATLDWMNDAARPPRPGRLACDVAIPDPADHEAAVADVVARIAAGEIFQANIARAWTGRLVTGARPVDLALRLADASPAPFAAYLRLPGLALVSNSPERFLRVRPQGATLVAETRPIKGTVPRGATPAEDACLAAQLAASVKDRAENLMIVDLMRNDLARVSTPGTVRVPELFAVEQFANVSHLVSTVTATLAPGRTAVDLLAAACPPGSITGAPKVQAMKVIAGHEPPRGPFFGSMFWAGFDGALDSSVLIRTAAFTEDAAGWRFEARAGGGVVADSDPVAERLETEAKISALLAALALP
ncbi:MAG TPA: anthranilate synthase component I family protein [Caulobacteraceae bacterium]|jgi:para-aminobenzoate synthetase component 1